MPIGSVVINELLSHSDRSNDWIEIYNATADTVDLSGWFLSDSATNLTAYVFPGGTLLAAGAYLVLDEHEFNNRSNPACHTPFAFSELGEEAHLVAAAGGVPSSYHETVRFAAADQETTFGRYVRSDGPPVFTAASRPTPGESNAPPLVGPVVLSEVMYHPLSNRCEFIEIQAVTSAVTLFDPLHPSNTWAFRGGVDFTFPTGVVLAAGEYALVAPVSAGVFRALYRLSNSVAVFGPYSNALNNAGDRIRLWRPGRPEATGYVPPVLGDELDYDDLPPWPAGANGTGRALERIDLQAYGNDPVNWRASLYRCTPGGPLIDADGNGIPDAWELRQFGTTGTAGGADADGDGLSNDGEFVAGTDATNATSRPMLTLRVDESNVVVEFGTVSADGPGYAGLRRLYGLETCADLTTSTWQRIAGWDGILGDGGVHGYTNAAEDRARFQRLRIRLVPAE
jgi:hypothetical protein